LYRTNISYTCRGNSKGHSYTHGGFIWRYENKNNIIPDIPVVVNLKSEFSPHSINCYQYSSDGKFVRKWNCSMDVKRELGYTNTKITEARLYHRTAYGFKWLPEYKGEFIEPFPKNKWEEKKLKQNDC